jgi:two-component sensor histidine kinase/CHASE1-domain containing sensor protein
MRRIAQLTRARKSPLLLIILPVLALGLGLTVWLTSTVWRWEEALVQEEFRRRAEHQFGAVRRETELLLRLTHAAQAFCLTSEQFTRKDFETFAERMLKAYPSAAALGWAPRVPNELRDRHVQLARQDGLAQYQIWSVHPDSTNTEQAAHRAFYPLTYLHPLNDFSSVLGFDIGSEPVRREALDQARTNRSIRVSRMINLMPARNPHQGFLIVAPVLSSHGNPADEESTLAGYVICPIRLDQVIAASFRFSELSGLDVHLSETSAGEPKDPDPDGSAPQSGPLHFKRDFAFGERLWRFECSPVKHLSIPHHSVTPLVTAAAGCAFTAGLALFISGLHLRTQRVKHLVEQRTIELTRSKEGLEKEIAARAAAEVSLNRSLAEKQVLLREIHHRVKNNLQVICSLLQLQAGVVNDTLAARLLREMRGRVRTVALVYDRVCQSDDMASIEFDEYVRALAGELFRFYRPVSASVALKVDITPVLLNIDTAIPVGLIVTELVANSLKYAFPQSFVETQPCGYHPGIFVNLTSSDEDFTLVIGDNGVGLPAEVNLSSDGTIGIQIAVMLVEQLNGHVDLRREAGTQYEIRFRQLAYKERC